jgi:hypothetical protein
MESTMSHPLTLVLSAQERETLAEVVRTDHRAYLRERASFLLKLADGQTIPWIAAHGLLTVRQRETLYRWRAAYCRGGIEALVMRPRGHRGFPPSAGRTRGHGGPSGTGAVRLPAGPVATH